jgi:hypothetical protein
MATSMVNARRERLASSACPRRVGAVLIAATLSLVIGGLAPGSASARIAAAAPVAIPSPVSGGWQLNGSAVLNPSASPPNLQLTPNTTWVAGSAFWPTAVPGAGVTASFDMFIGSSSTSGAEGMTFTLADASVTKPTALGHNGGGEGFAGITGIAVSFDTWKADNASDPSNSFVGIAATNPSQPRLNYVTTNASIPPLRNTLHHVTVATTSTGIVVTMDGTQVLNYAISLPSQVLVGFTAATGAATDVHQVQNVNITTGPPPPAPTVTGVSPTSGPSMGGTAVTITGTALTGATGVKFGSAAATAFTVNSDTSITATAPAAQAGAVDVTVTTAGGTSATSSADQFTYVAPPPTVTIVNPNSGPAGTPVTVSGTNFTGVTEVDFGPGNKASFTVNNSTTLTATAPPGTGTVDVTVTTASGTSKTLTDDQFTYAAGLPPGTIPSPTAGGWQLNGSAVLNPSASPPNLQLTPNTTWQAGSAFWPTPVASSGITASFDMFIGSSNTTSGAEGMTFTLADASVAKPTAWGHNGGGLGFAGITGIAVAFDTWKLTNYPSNNFVGIAATNPSQPSLSYVTTNASIPPLRNTLHHVVVTTDATGISVTMDGNQVLAYNITLPSKVLIGFTGATGGTTDVHQVQNVNITTGPPPPAPTVTGVSPTSGPSTGGTPVTITGTSFTGATGVKFGTAAATNVSVNTDTSITATAPAGSAGAVDVTVTGPGGTSATSPADQFTYTPPPVPTVTGLSPGSGPSTGGTPVTITGTGFTGATAVDFGSGNTATFSVTNDTTIAATAPPNATLGAVDVTVTTPGGTSSTTTADQFTYVTPPPPTVTAVSPNGGPAGTSVTITGTNFSGATAVDFGSGNSATFSVSNPTTITATAPASSSTGAVDVTVTTPGGTSATSSADQFTYQAGPLPTTMVDTYRGNQGRTGYYPSQTGVTASNVATLNTHWTDGTSSGTGSYAQPIVANNLIYWGDWNGAEHATDFTGHDVWTVTTGQNVDSACSPSVAGISGTATLGTIGSTPVDWFPGGDDNFYAVNALTGAILWKTNLGTPPADYLWGSPILYNGSIYQPVASFGDCPLVNGRLVQMDATTGAIQHTAYMAPSGCTGGGIWGSPAVDPSDNSIYVATGNAGSCSTPELAPSIVKLNASDLTVISSWTVPKAAQSAGDPDFGTTPVLFTATINGTARSLVGALDKNGIFYAWDRSNLAAGPVWQSTVASPSGSPRSIASTAWDGTRLYVGAGGVTLNGTSFFGNISALDPATGAFLWRTGVTGFMSAGITVVPGVLIEPYGAGGNLLFLDPATGAQLRLFSMKNRADGEATVWNGVIYVSDDKGNLLAIGQ